jgi:stearoyl-CoA desaturase (delta-9 desaturase)
LGAYLAFHGSPLWWATIHRTHHRYVDTPLDPHAPGTKGGFAAYAFYTAMQYPPHINPAKQSKDLLKDPIYAFLEQPGKTWHRAYALCVCLSLLFRVALWIAFGPIIAGASLLAGIAALNVPLLLNVFCHIPKLGYKNFQLKDDSVNVWWMALVCAGEGWHNNHHAYPASAKSGGKAWEIDPSWCVLRALKSVGLVTYMNESINDDRSDNKGELPGDGGPKVPLTVVLKEPEPASVV